MNTNFKVIGLTRLEIKPESTAPEADALTTRPSELLNWLLFTKSDDESGQASDYKIGIRSFPA